MERDPKEPDDWCDWCGGPLPLDRYWGMRKYCSTRCSNAYRNSLETEAKRADNAGRQCAECGGQIPATARTDARFCSRRCRGRQGNRRYNRRQWAAYRQQRDRARLNRTCAECGGRIPLERNGKARFCSRGCKNACMNRRKGTRQATA